LAPSANHISGTAAGRVVTLIVSGAVNLCDKLVTVVGYQFITLTVFICVQHGGREARRRAGLPSAAETYLSLLPIRLLKSTFGRPISVLPSAFAPCS